MEQSGGVVLWVMMVRNRPSLAPAPVQYPAHGHEAGRVEPLTQRVTNRLCGMSDGCFHQTPSRHSVGDGRRFALGCLADNIQRRFPAAFR